MYTTLSKRVFPLYSDPLYSELVVDKRNVGRLRLRYNDICKRNLKDLNVEIGEWRKLTGKRNK